MKSWSKELQLGEASDRQDVFHLSLVVSGTNCSFLQIELQPVEQELETRIELTILAQLVVFCDTLFVILKGGNI